MGDLINRKATLEALNSNPNIRTIRGGVSGIWINLLDAIGEIERVPAAEPVWHGRWISVKEREPEKLQRALVYSPVGNRIASGVYTEVGFITQAVIGEITHWMEIPNPPKEG